jgi:hypothetical protein
MAADARSYARRTASGMPPKKFLRVQVPWVIHDITLVRRLNFSGHALMHSQALVRRRLPSQSRGQPRSINSTAGPAHQRRALSSDLIAHARSITE